MIQLKNRGDEAPQERSAALDQARDVVAEQVLVGGLSFAIEQGGGRTVDGREGGL